MKNSKILYENVDVYEEHVKIEIVSSTHNCRNCESVLAEINRLYQESGQYQVAKEYEFSINALNRAFEETYFLTQPEEQESAKLLRNTITESLENIYRELKFMTSGIFRRAHYKSSFKMAAEILEEFRKNSSAFEQKYIPKSLAVY